MPFQNVSTPETYFPSSLHEEARGRIFYAISYDKGGVLFTGEVGMGKTTVGKVVIDRLKSKDVRVGLIANPTLDIIDFLREILFRFGIKAVETSKFDLIHKIHDLLTNNFRAGKKTVLIIDEAHLITDTAILEEIRLLLNFQYNDKFLMTLVLIGQPELRKIIHSIPPLEQRLSIKFHLKHLPFNDTKNYIFYRLKHAGAKDPVFTTDALKLIHKYTRGIPRRINQICDLSLLIGFSEKKYCVDASIVEKVIADAEKHGCENG
ncbi:MAG: AAA family ATPase [Deltaproteobacteria bacterium]|nr:AAA family ATPase [Deltaproteobacteria bacterium]